MNARNRHPATTAHHQPMTRPRKLKSGPGFLFSGIRPITVQEKYVHAPNRGAERFSESANEPPMTTQGDPEKCHPWQFPRPTSLCRAGTSTLRDVLNQALDAIAVARLVLQEHCPQVQPRCRRARRCPAFSRAGERKRVSTRSSQ